MTLKNEVGTFKTNVYFVKTSSGNFLLLYTHKIQKLDNDHWVDFRTGNSTFMLFAGLGIKREGNTYSGYVLNDKHFNLKTEVTIEIKE